MKARDGVVWFHMDHLRRMAAALRAEGFRYLHCPDWECGEFTVLPEGQSWQCPSHGTDGVEP